MTARAVLALGVAVAALGVPELLEVVHFWRPFGLLVTAKYGLSAARFGCSWGIQWGAISGQAAAGMLLPGGAACRAALRSENPGPPFMVSWELHADLAL
jgi:hypothetical protein